MNDRVLEGLLDEMEKIAISENYLLSKAMNALHKSPTGRVPAQFFRAISAAKRKNFKGAEEKLLKAFGEWKQGKHPQKGAPVSFKKKTLNNPKQKSPKKDIAWKGPAIAGGAAGGVGAAAYGVHRYNESTINGY